MYIPKQFEETNTSVLHALVRSNPLGTWVSENGGSLVVNHIPFILDEARGPLGTLVGHVARANDVWKLVSSGAESVVVFQGAQAYITPSWYPTKHEHGKVVPTWNYAVVHAHGRPKAIDDREWLLNHVAKLTGLHESQREMPWQVSDAPTEFIAALLDAIVGIEIPIARLAGKWKASQNRTSPDKLGVIAGLRNIDSDDANDMAALIEARDRSGG